MVFLRGGDVENIAMTTRRFIYTIPGALYETSLWQSVQVDRAKLRARIKRSKFRFVEIPALVAACPRQEDGLRDIDSFTQMVFDLVLRSGIESVNPESFHFEELVAYLSKADELIAAQNKCWPRGYPREAPESLYWYLYENPGALLTDESVWTFPPETDDEVITRLMSALGLRYIEMLLRAEACGEDTSRELWTNIAACKGYIGTACGAHVRRNESSFIHAERADKRWNEDPAHNAMDEVRAEFDRWQDGLAWFKNYADFAKKMHARYGAAIENEGSIKNNCTKWSRERKNHHAR